MSRSRASALRRAAPLTLLALAAGLAVLIGPLASPAGAHAKLVATSPAGDEVIERAPEQVTLTFDESVEAFADGVRVFDPSGGRVDRGQTEVSDDGLTVSAPFEEADSQGTYTVSWRVLSEDSHNLSGSFVFHVGTETGGADIGDDANTLVDVVGGLARWVGYAGALVALGAAVLALANPGEPAVCRRLRVVVMAAAGSAAVATAVVLVAQTADIAGRDLLDSVTLAFDVAPDTRTGRLALLRLALLAAAAIAAAIGPLWMRRPWVAGGLTVGAMVTWPLSGHAWTTSPRLVSVLADLVHLVAVGVWVGGLFALGCSLLLAHDKEAMARRFSRVAVVTVFVVAISGSISGYWQVRSIDALFGTGYGQLLALKVVGFAGLVVIGWFNRQRLATWIDGSAQILVRFVRAEVAIAVVVLALTAALVNQPPAKDTASRPFAASVASEAGDGTLEITVAPARVGQNDIHLYFFDDAGRTLVPVDAVEMTAGTDQIAPRRIDLQPLTPSHFSAYGASLATPGTWTLTVTAIREGQPSTFEIEVEIR